MMKRLIFIILSAVALCSCSPKAIVKACADGSLDVSFKTGFSDATGATLRRIAGIPSGAPIFSPNDMTMFLLDAGATNVSATTPTAQEVEANGKIKDLSHNALASTGILSRKANAVTLTLGPNQIRTLYTLLDDETKSYFDMMMIPALLGETLSKDEYRMILSAMYGRAFSDELIDGEVLLELSSPDGKKTQRISEKLGDILTLEKEKSWTLNF